MLLFKVGDKSLPVNLDEAMRHIHEENRAWILAERKRREENGIPLSEGRPWRSIVADLAKGKDEDAYRLTLELGASVAGALVDPGEYKSDPDAATLEIVFRAVDRESYAALESRMEALRAKKKKAPEDEEIVKALVEGARNIVSLMVDEVRGFIDHDGNPIPVKAGPGGLDDDTVRAIAATGYLDQFYSVCRAYAGLRGDEKKAFGRPRSPGPNASSPSSAATPAPPTTVDSEAAPSPPLVAIGPAPSTSTAPVHGERSSSIPGSLTSSSSTTSYPVSGEASIA